MRNDKIFKTLDEQIEILESKGLIINDLEKCKMILFRENYFFISGYRHLFMTSIKDNHFVEGATFDELYAMFSFDRTIRNIFFKWILVVENNFKSITSYVLSKKYGFKDKDYLNPKNFTQDSMKTRQVRDILNKMRRQIRVNGKEHSATLHYMDNYGYIPLWILVKVLSFGIMSEFYSILKNEDQSTIANVYDIDIDSLSQYLSIVANYRNICAHEEVLYNHRTQKVIRNNKYHYELDIKNVDGEYVYGKNDLFSLVIILKTLLVKEDFTDLINEISYEVDRLSGQIHSVDIKKILNNCGFPDNWEDIAKI
ncbi:MAG TPA: Abi family protein [Bacilli bacterium]|nr:Abi family protein [Bacilli bacterium]